jgi:hypothetical protein
VGDIEEEKAGKSARIGDGLESLQRFNADGLTDPEAPILLPEEEDFRRRIRELQAKKPKDTPASSGPDRFVGPSDPTKAGRDK